MTALAGSTATEDAADLMHRAAALLRERADDATAMQPWPGRWKDYTNAAADPFVCVDEHRAFGRIVTPTHGVADYGKAYAEHVAALDPDVARALAEWLTQHAAVLRLPAWHGDRIADHNAALTLARTYLREDPTP